MQTLECKKNTGPALLALVLRSAPRSRGAVWSLPGSNHSIRFVFKNYRIKTTGFGQTVLKTTGFAPKIQDFVRIPF